MRLFNYEAIYRLKQLRGKAYYRHLKYNIAHSEPGEMIAIVCKAIQERHGHIRLVDIGIMSLAFGMDVKPLLDVLTWRELAPHGIYEHWFEPRRKLTDGRWLSQKTLQEDAKKIFQDEFPFDVLELPADCFFLE